jgi:hypothetical protein
MIPNIKIYIPYNPKESNLLLVKDTPTNDRMMILGILPIMEAKKKLIQPTLLNPQIIFTTGAGIIGIKRLVKIAIKEFRVKNSSYSFTFGYLLNLDWAISLKPYLLRKKKHIVPTIAPVNEIKTACFIPNTAPMIPAKTGNGMRGKKTQMAINNILTRIAVIPPSLIMCSNVSF